MNGALTATLSSCCTEPHVNADASVGVAKYLAGGLNILRLDEGVCSDICHQPLMAGTDM